MSVAWPYGLEWCVEEGGGHDPIQKDSVTLFSPAKQQIVWKAALWKQFTVSHMVQREEMIKLACAVVNS